jgi:hypothetical protein
MKGKEIFSGGWLMMTREKGADCTGLLCSLCILGVMYGSIVNESME